MNTYIFILLHLENFKIGRRIYKNTNKFFLKFVFVYQPKNKKKEIPLKKRMIYFVSFVFLHVETKKKHTKTY